MTGMAKLLAMCLAAGLVLASIVLPARAETPLHRPVEVNFDGVSIQNALATLGERAGVRFEYEAELMKGQYSVTHKAEDQEAGRVAMRILYPRGLELGEIRGNRVTVLKRDPYDEFQLKREEVYEFAQKPTLRREGDDVTISFETAGWCDVTVAIEDDQGDIIRHLASGVLGPNAPEPFVWNSKAQTLVWDGKDDAGVYVDDKDTVTVRVSLGLKPQFQRTLYWSPKKRLHQGQARWGFVGTQAGLPTPRIAAAPEGVYVFEGRGLDHLRLFNHDGNYVRTVYPPPAARLEEIVGLTWHTFPQGDRLPLKHDILQTTLLTSGPSGKVEMVPSMFGNAATALAVRNGRVALVHRRLNRLHSDGSSGGLPLVGPKTSFEVTLRLDGIEQRRWWVSPTSAAFCPDGRWLYCTGYLWRQGRHSARIQKDSFHGVIRIDFERNGEAEVFVGSMEPHDSGTENGQFRDATSVACDSAGRVYVSDYMNDRIQVFSPEGNHLKNIEAFKPALVRIHHRTGEIYVFSWMYDHFTTFGHDDARRRDDRLEPIEVPPQLTRLGPFDDPRPRAVYPLPLLQRRDRYSRYRVWAGLEFTAELNSWTDPPTIWLVPGVPATREPQDEVPFIGHGQAGWEETGIRFFAEQDGKLEIRSDFADQARRAVRRLVPPMFARQRLYVNPATGLLYVAEGQTTHYKAFKDLLVIDPATGGIRKVRLPFDAEDMAFDTQGRVYLRSHDLIVRYEMDTWREVPFDYGERRTNVGTSESRDTRRTDVLSGLPLYNRTGWHKGGIDVNVAGDIIATCYLTKGDAVPPLALRMDPRQIDRGDAKPYVPQMYPGRMRFAELHIWNRHGQRVYDDVLMGLANTCGVGIDRDRNVYVMAAPTRVINGQRYFNRLSGTLMKCRPQQGRIISKNSHLIPFPLADADAPARPYDVMKGGSPGWVEGVDWLYGGVGYFGHNAGGCGCYNSRFVLDYFARSFAPEVRRFCVAVLDSAGNLVVRVGQYGNVDDGMPLNRNGGPPNPRAIGGDEVALFHPAYVATHTDHRLFIADPGNARIVSVKLGYHTERRIELKNVNPVDGTQ